MWTWLIEKIGLKGILLALGALALGLFIFLAWRHYTGLINENSVLKVNSALLQTSLNSQKDTIEAQEKALGNWKKNQEETQALLNKALSVSQSANEEVKKLNAFFIKHDVVALAHKKPILLQDRINSGSNRARFLLECATGFNDSNCPREDRATQETNPTPTGTDKNKTR
jgi:hypothetical protein